MPGKFIAPHGMGVDSAGNIYVGEVSFTMRGRNMDPPAELEQAAEDELTRPRPPPQAAPVIHGATKMCLGAT